MFNINKKESYKNFGEQFVVDKKIDEYWGSKSLLKDIVHPFNLNKIKNKIIMEVGSGSGRILKNLLKFKPNKIYSIEPSKAIQVAKENNKKNLNKILFFNIKGENINFNKKFDYIFSLGVIHHTPNDKIILRNIYRSLKSKGKFIFWVYSYEGNEIYLKFFLKIRKITIFIPDFSLRLFCFFLNILCYFYIFFCNYFNLPSKKYFINVFSKCSFSKRSYIIFDQLNPSYAKYYKKHEVLNLLKSTHFKLEKIIFRHKYSWTVICSKIR